MLDILKVLQESISSESTAARNGFLQKCDPRFKLISLLLFLIASVLSTNIIELVILYTFVIILSLISSINLFFFFKRTLFFVPIFSLFMVIPALFSFVTPGIPVLNIHIYGKTLAITKAGIDSSIILFTRILVAVSISALLVLTTRQSVLLRVLRIFKVPQLFVMTIGMGYRYIFYLLDIIHNTFTAIKSRVGSISSTGSGQKIVGIQMAGLWMRSYQLHTQVYDAMISRGYTGEPRIIDQFKAKIEDYVFLTIAISTLIGILWLNQYFH